MSKEDRIQPGGQPNNEPTVRIPLSKYLDLLAKAKMGSEPKVVRTHAQRASEALARIGADVSSVLPVLMSPKLRGREGTKQRCSNLGRKIYHAVRKVYYYSDYSEDATPAHIILDEAYHHYEYYYDPEARGKMEQRAQIVKETLFDFNTELYLPNPEWKNSPVFTEYKHQLPLELRPFLPLYIATYFVPRPHLPFPQELLPQ